MYFYKGRRKRVRQTNQFWTYFWFSWWLLVYPCHFAWHNVIRNSNSFIFNILNGPALIGGVVVHVGSCSWRVGGQLVTNVPPLGQIWVSASVPTVLPARLMGSLHTDVWRERPGYRLAALKSHVREQSQFKVILSNEKFCSNSLVRRSTVLHSSFSMVFSWKWALSTRVKSSKVPLWMWVMLDE